MSPAHLVSLTLALVVGFMAWSATFALTGGESPFAWPRLSDRLVFFAPLLCVALPLFVRAAMERRPVRAFWLVAIAPLLGWLDVLALVLLNVVFNPVGPSYPAASIAAAAAWLVPGAWILFKWRNASQISKGAHG